MNRLRQCQALVAMVVAGGFLGPAMAQSDSAALETCLTTWNNHPFGGRPVYKSLPPSTGAVVNGVTAADAESTDMPSLVLVQPGVNVMGGARLALLNPNGWYCLHPAVNVMGGLKVRLHCRARLAAASGGATVWNGGVASARSTVLGGITVEPVGCAAW